MTNDHQWERHESNSCASLFRGAGQVEDSPLPSMESKRMDNNLLSFVH